MLAVDTETNGLDIHHGCKPFIITICNESLENTCWVWDVDPLTREPIIPTRDILEFENEIEGEELAFLNPVFDILALSKLKKRIGDRWPWKKTHDIGLSSHIIDSIYKPRTLTSLAYRYLGVDLNPLEEKVATAVKAARKIAKDQFPEWRIAEEGLEGLPSCKDGGKSGDAEAIKVWKNDMWLPRAIAKALNYPKSHPWWTVTEDYANGDTLATIAICKQHLPILKEKRLEWIYRKRVELLPVMYNMSNRGVSLNKLRAKKLEQELTEEYESKRKVCEEVAELFGYGLTMPKGSNNNSLKDFVFEVMELPVIELTDTGQPALNSKRVLPHYKDTLDQDTPEWKFVDALFDYRKSGTHLGYLNAYARFWRQVQMSNGNDIWVRLHPSLNPTGADTLRWSSANPNSQNISKKGKYNLRKAFGPLPGREWWSCDAKNIELRIPAYESGEQTLIDLFENPGPPYYGSEHILNFSVVYPDIWEEEVKAVGLDKAGPHIKDKYKDTWYQWCKNGDFAVGYGAIDRDDGEGTADLAFHRPGSHARLKERFAAKEKLNQKWIGFATKHGYVETLPDRTVDPEQGYPLRCTRNDWGGILQTVPLNYHVQSTAMWVTMRAMILIQEYFDKINRKRDKRDWCYLIMQVHDEVVIDLPKKPNKGNWALVQEILAIIGSIGQDLIPSMPLPFGAELHTTSWDTGETLA